MVVLITLVWIISISMIVGTLLPMSGSVRWWIRAWEFPRLHIAIIATLCLVAVLALPIANKTALSIGLFVCAVYQFARVFPYTRFAPNEIAFEESSDADEKVTLIAANVLMENTRKTDLIKIIEREDPDVLLLMETDQSWLDAFQDCLGRYSTVVTYPIDNHYGLIFATRLKCPSAQIEFLSVDNTPSLRAELIGPTGEGFNFIGLHPRPPVPGNDTVTRDEQIKKAALLTNNANWPTVCMGDFNDVAWSWTSKRFKQYGGFLEPRVGRGMYSTFHAQYPLISLPIDQLFITSGIGVISFGLLEDFGSDHYPVTAAITIKKTQEIASA